MKTTSIIALTAALMISATPLAMAQTSGTVNANANVSGSADTGAGANPSVDLSFDTDGDGVVSDAEAQAGSGEDANTAVETDMSLDTNADGTISDEEAAAGGVAAGATAGASTGAAAGAAATGATAGAAGSVIACDATGFEMETMNGVDKVADISSATSAQVVPLSDCEEGNGLSADVQNAITGNSVLADILRTESYNYDQIVGIDVTNGSATIYVAAGTGETE